MTNTLSAWRFAKERHAGQTRRYTGEPYLNHLTAVAALVRQVGGDDDVVSAAILHDVLEDTATTAAELREIFGDRVADLVVELTDHFPAGSGGNRRERKEKEAARLAAASADAQTIKVADLMDNTRSIMSHDPNFARVYLTEKSNLLDVLTKANPTLLAMARRERPNASHDHREGVLREAR